MSSIKTLKLNNYRNYKESIFNFLPNINIICGKNGVGKTNILESISLLSSGKGMLNSDAEEILNKESLSEQWSIFADINEDEIIDAITVYLDENKKKKVKLNGNVIKGREELNEIFNIVWVIPQMQNFFVEDRSVRRKFLDRCVYLLDVQHAKRVA
ncbi:MAG: AAA family ATPase, partial [Rickettsiales bacterium]|nr:AAA family ATPase [Rickettsiales bacterium]